jgi:hypothetical protein
LPQPHVAIVILNWNGRKFLEQFLPSVLATDYEGFEVIVADNASSDDSLAFLRQYYPGIRIIQNPGNEGFARGYNLALAQVKADYYVLLNSDVEVDPGWVRPVVALMEGDPQSGACQPKLLAFHQKDHFEYAGAAGGWIDALGYPFARGRVMDVCERDERQYNDAARVCWASGAAMFVRASAWHACGGLDEYFFAHQEEIDLCWRMQLAGYNIYVQPASVVYHVGGGTLPKGNSLKVKLNFSNNLIMLSKNLPFAELLWKLPLRFGLDAVSAWLNLLKGDSGYFVAVVKAHWRYANWLLGKKAGVRWPQRRGRVRGGYYAGCVPWQYFAKKKRRFSEIVENKR